MESTYLAWIFFIAGMAASTFLRASNVVASAQSGVETYRHFFTVQAAPIAVRVLVAIGAFATTMQAEASVSIQTAVLSGVSFDSVLDKMLPLLASQMRKDVPPAAQPPAGGV